MGTQYVEYQVRLYRDGLSTPWGFRLQGGTDFKAPLTIQRVFVGSPAEGELHRGDVIIAIDNHDAQLLTHKEAQDVIKNAGGSMSLRVKRGTRDIPIKTTIIKTPQRQPAPQPVQTRPAAVKPLTPKSPGMSGSSFGVDYRQAGHPQVQYQVQSPSDPMLNRVQQSLGEAIYRGGPEEEDPYTTQSITDLKRKFQPQQRSGGGAHRTGRRWHKPSEDSVSSGLRDPGWAPKSLLAATSRSPGRSHAYAHAPAPAPAPSSYTFTPAAPQAAPQAPPQPAACYQPQPVQQTIYKPSPAPAAQPAAPTYKPVSPAAPVYQPGAPASAPAPAAAAAAPAPQQQGQEGTGRRPAWMGTLKGAGVMKPWEVEAQQDVQAANAPAHVHQPRLQTVHYAPGQSPQYQQHSPNIQSDTAQVKHLQYNSPMGLYSNKNVQETLQGQVGGKAGSGTMQVQQPTGPPKEFDPNKSAVYQFLHQEDKPKRQRQRPVQPAHHQEPPPAAPSAETYGTSDF